MGKECHFGLILVILDKKCTFYVLNKGIGPRSRGPKPLIPLQVVAGDAHLGIYSYFLKEWTGIGTKGPIPVYLRVYIRI